VSKTIKILIADDHAIVRKSIRAVLEDDTEFEVVAEAATGVEAIEKAQVIHPDIAILDIRMPGMSGIEACRQIHDSVRSCRIIMLTSYAEEELLRVAVQAGATGFILKQVAGSELLQAIKHVSRGESILDLGMTDRALNSIHLVAKTQVSAEFPVLTPQELAGLVDTKGITD
jgi:DNA-binding NarL/FixJ family response regulator